VNLLRAPSEWWQKKSAAICHTTAESTLNQTIERYQYCMDEHSSPALIVPQRIRG